MKRIHLVHTNDLHSHLEAMAMVDTYVTEQRNKWEADGESGFLLDIGDHLDRVRLETEGTNGRINRAIMECSGYDMVTLGNNELLTFSREELADIYTDASFQVVCSNVEDALFLPYQAYWCDGVNLAFIGVTVRFQELYQQIGWKVTDPMKTLRKLVKELHAQGYLIIVLSHLGYPSDVSLAKEIPDIDIIMGGHTHHLLENPEKIGKTILAAAGKHGKYIGHLELLCADNGKLEEVKGGAFPLQIKPSTNILSLISQFRNQAIEDLAEPVAFLEEELPANWEEETPFANLLADSLVQWTGVKFGVVNNGLLLSSLSKGIVTKQVLHAACPHPINPVVLSISGKDLRLTLEESLLEDYTRLELHGFGFRGKVLGSLAVSGMTVVFDPMNPPHHKIQKIYMGQELLEDEKMYQISTISMFVYGIGYKRLSKGTVIHYYVPESLRTVLAKGLQSSDLRLRSYLKRWITAPSKEEYGDNVPKEK